MKSKLACFTLFLFVFSFVSFASIKTPTITGSTGLIKMPTAVVLGQKDFNFAIDYVVDGAIVGTGSDTQGIWQYKANIGALSTSTRGLELGFVGRTEKVTNRFKEGVFINIKYSLSSSDDIDALKLAIGVENISSLSETDAYMVASKFWPGGAGIHFGAMFDFPNYNKFRPLGMFGINMPIGSKSFMLQAELFAGESLFQLNGGMNYDINKNFSILARGVNLTNSSDSRDSKSISIGISLSNFI